MYPAASGTCPRPKSIEGTILLTVRILENARKEPENLKREWYRSRACQDLLELAGINKDLYREILGFNSPAGKENA